MAYSGARRVQNLPPYLFARIDRLIEEKKAQGVDVISLGIGDPVEPTPDHIIEAHVEALRDPENHRYPSYTGLRAFRVAAARWMEQRFGVTLDPDREILPLIGSKEGIAHTPWALVNEGEVVLVPNPGYPVYETATLLAGAEPYHLPLREENAFLADVRAVPTDIARRASLMFLNYPNNPTSATADLAYFTEVVEWARENGILIAHDNAYSEITFGSYAAPSILEVEGARDIAIEFHSLSKSYNMTGWRIGFAAGNAEAIDALGRLKTNIDSGIFNPIQYAGIEALERGAADIAAMVRIYERRRERVCAFLDRAGIHYWKSDATIYVWVRVPDGETSESFTSFLLEKAGVVVSPGSAYGHHGEGYIRISLTVPDSRLEEALSRLESVL